MKRTDLVLKSRDWVASSCGTAAGMTGIRIREPAYISLYPGTVRSGNHWLATY